MPKTETLVKFHNDLCRIYFGKKGVALATPKLVNILKTPLEEFTELQLVALLMDYMDMDLADKYIIERQFPLELFPRHIPQALTRFHDARIDIGSKEELTFFISNTRSYLMDHYDVVKTGR